MLGGGPGILGLGPPGGGAMGLSMGGPPGGSMARSSGGETWRDLSSNTPYCCSIHPSKTQPSEQPVGRYR